MDPKIISAEESEGYKLTDEKIEKLLSYWGDARAYRESAIIPRMARNLRLMKGVPVEEESSRSKVTNKNKLYFRKIWSSAQRLLASMFQAYLQDKNKFQISGRDEAQDYKKAKVLEIMTRFRFDWMMRRRNLFVRMLWALFNCIAPGFTVVKHIWKYNEEFGIDEPDFIVYPLEQVILDWPELTSGDTNNMRFVMFENYYTADMMEDLGYENISKITEAQKPVNELEQTRYIDSVRPFQGSNDPSGYVNGAAGNNYPAMGSQPQQCNPYLIRYLALEMYYREKGYLYHCVINPETRVVLSKAIVNPSGRDYPVSIGYMLIDPHKAVPEGLPEILEGPQESLNLTINLRKDNVMLAMNGGFIYSRFANVDKQSLQNIRPGFTVAADNVEGVQPIRIPDVTQSAYVEAAQYMNMMDDMSAVNPTKQGTSDATKATVAQINLTEANAKHDLFVATVGQTLFHQFIYNLAKQISMFETDETIFRVANEALRKEGNDPHDNDIYDIEFDFDVEISAGLSEVGRGIRSQQINMAMQTAQMSNNSTIMALKSGIQIENPKIFDLGQMQADLMPELGLPSVQKYLVSVAPPAPEQPKQPGNDQVEAVEGQNAAQPNEAPDGAGMEDFLRSLTGG